MIDLRAVLYLPALLLCVTLITEPPSCRAQARDVGAPITDATSPDAAAAERVIEATADEDEETRGPWVFLGGQLHLGEHPEDFATILPEFDLLISIIPFLRAGVLFGGGFADTTAGERGAFKFGAYAEGYLGVSLFDFFLRAGGRLDFRSGAGLPDATGHAPFVTLGCRLTSPPLDSSEIFRVYFTVDQQFLFVTSDGWMAAPIFLGRGAIQWSTGIGVGIAL